MSFQWWMCNENMVYTHTNGILVIQNNELMKFVGKWIEGEDIVSEVIETQKDECHIFSVIVVFSSESSDVSNPWDKKNKMGSWSAESLEG